VHRRLELAQVRARVTVNGTSSEVASPDSLVDLDQRLVEVLHPQLGIRQRLLRKVQLIAVMGGQEEQPQRLRIDARQRVAKVNHVAEALGHLGALEIQEAAVHPVPGKWLVKCRLALSDLVLVVREDQILSAPMN